MLVALGMSLVLAVSVALLGERVDQLLDQESLVAMLGARPAIGWLVAIALLVADLFLPIPGTAVITGLGMVYGAALGSLIGMVGLLAAGVVPYLAARSGGERLAGFIASAEEMEQFRAGFDRWGSVAIVATRMLPIVPEVLCVLAGLVGMSFRRLILAVAIGAAPVAVLFATIGERFVDRPLLAFGLGLGLPLLAWAGLRTSGLLRL